MRRHVLSLLTIVSLSWSLAAQSTARKDSTESTRRSDDTVAYATATMRLREKPSPTARAVAIVAQGTRLRLYHCSEGWCGVSVQRTAGYALEEFLTTTPPVQPKATSTATPPTKQGRGYTNSLGQWVPSPVRTADGQPPAGASAKCRDGTFSFSRHRQGTCSHHGGVADWL